MAKTQSTTATDPPAGSVATTPRNGWFIAVATVAAVLVGLGAGPAEAAKRHQDGAGKVAVQAAPASAPTITISRDMASDLPPVAQHLRPSMASPLAGEF
ncbi:MAG: hypothetical protein J0653_01055, partial [Deltaproteobacteria bacterium]|nr:hypothetical protein [Deltaproteobacteria bacterium]